MSPVFDIQCPKCGKTEEVVCHSSEKDCMVCACGEVMKSIPSAANFNVKGFNAKNLYGGRQ